jgi:hypothetical protein
MKERVVTPEEAAANRKLLQWIAKYSMVFSIIALVGIFVLTVIISKH